MQLGIRDKNMTLYFLFPSFSHALATCLARVIAYFFVILWQVCNGSKILTIDLDQICDAEEAPWEPCLIWCDCTCD